MCCCFNFNFFFVVRILWIVIIGIVVGSTKIYHHRNAFSAAWLFKVYIKTIYEPANQRLGTPSEIQDKNKGSIKTPQNYQKEKKMNNSLMKNKRFQQSFGCPFLFGHFVGDKRKTFDESFHYSSQTPSFLCYFF